MAGRFHRVSAGRRRRCGRGIHPRFTRHQTGRRMRWASSAPLAHGDHLADEVRAHAGVTREPRTQPLVVAMMTGVIAAIMAAAIAVFTAFDTASPAAEPATSCSICFFS